MPRRKKTLTEATKPVCKLVGENGNAFFIIGRVQRVLREADLGEQADEFRKRATSASSYDEFLQVVMNYVEVE